MKIFTDNAVYVQKNDIAFLNQTDLEIPISTKVYGSGRVPIDNHNRYEFVLFDAPEEIKFFESLDWMIDYNKVKDLSEETIIDLIGSIAEEKNNIVQKFNSIPLEERKQNVNMLVRCDLLDFKMYSLRNILWFKQGHIKMELPDEVDLPSGYIQEKGIKRIMAKIFNKKNG